MGMNQSRAVRLSVTLIVAGVAGSLGPITVNGASPAPAALDEAALRAALDSMSAAERAFREDQFTSGRYTIVAYAREVQSFDLKTGRPILEPVASELETSALATSGITNLTITISVAFDNGVPCCRWNIIDWFDWTGTPPVNGSGKDQIATAWANGQALESDSAYGVYTNGANIPMNRNTMTPNAGVGWEFNECNAAYCNSYANWGYLAAGMYWPTRRNQPTNVVYTYFHTYQSQTYYVGVSGTGPSITITPTSSVMPTSVYTSFTN